MNRLATTRLLFLAAATTLAACSSTDRSIDPVTGLKAPEGPRASLIANGNINVCKLAGPAGTYHFHIDVSGGGHFTLTPSSGDNTIIFNGTTPACWSSAYQTVPDASWTPGLTATVTVSEVLLPNGTALDSIRLVDGQGGYQSTVIGNPALVITEGSTDIHTVNFYNSPAPSVTCAAITAFQGVAITPVSVTASGGTGGPYTFSATGLPDGVTMDVNGLISGTPTVTGSFNYTTTVKDKDGHVGTSTCTVVVGTPPSANCVTINAVQGNPITPVTLTATGGTGTGYTFSATGLPAGLTMDVNGTISGTPTVSGTYNYTVTIKDSAGNTGTLNCSVTVSTLPSAMCQAVTVVQGVPVQSGPLTGSGGAGGPYTFSATGLPAGLTMASDGSISGTTQAPSGPYNYTITIKDKLGNVGTINCMVTVNLPPSAGCASITAVAGVPITAVTLVGSGGTGGPYTFSATGLPAGLTISQTGTISGTPTAGGTFNYTVTVTDNSGNKGTVNCSVTVTVIPPSANCVVIVAVQGNAITPVTVVGSGGTGGPYTFSATGLPAGVTMDANGTISGTPSVSGSFNYTVTIKDKDGNVGTSNCSVTVNTIPSASCVLINAVQGVAITPATLTGSGGLGGPYTFTASGLPAGLTMSTSGTISGTPTVTGSFTYTVTIKDKAGNVGTISCMVTVYAPPSATCVSITAVQGVAITPATLTGSGGAGAPYTFTATGLPAGLTMSSSGTISGTPTVSGTFSYTVTVKDANGNVGTFNCSVTVAPPPTCPNCVSITAQQGVAITPATLTGTGGSGGPYTFTATGLPAGLTISSSGTISGTPTVSGSFTYTVTVKDKYGHAGSFDCTIVVAPPPSCTSCVSISAVKGVAISPTQLTGTGGAGGPYTFSATGLPSGLTVSSSGVVSGTPTVSGTFTYVVTVTDKYGHKGTFSCTVTVTTDYTPPVCNVYESASPPYMSYQDGGSGIVRLDVTTNLNSNFNVTISPTPTGTTFSPTIHGQPAAMPTGTVIKFPTPVHGTIKVSASRINSHVSAQLTVKATDAAGNTVSCDPIETTVMKLKQDDGVQEFDNVPYDVNLVTVENGGLRALTITVNGTDFNVKRLDDDEVRVVDVSSAMKKNGKNTIIITPKGKKGDTADITIAPPDGP